MKENSLERKRTEAVDLENKNNFETLIFVRNTSNDADMKKKSFT